NLITLVNFNTTNMIVNTSRNPISSSPFKIRIVCNVHLFFLQFLISRFKNIWFAWIYLSLYTSNDIVSAICNHDDSQGFYFTICFFYTVLIMVTLMQGHLIG